MKEVGVRFSITSTPLQVVTKPTVSRRRKSPLMTAAAPRNLFNQPQRSHQMQYTTVLPIISLSSLTDFKEKLVRMTSTNKSTKQTTAQSSIPTEFRLRFPSTEMPQIKLRATSSNRLAASNIPKSSLSYPTILPRPVTAHRSNQYHQQQPAERFLYVVNTPAPLQRSASARMTPQNNFTPLPLHQQPHLLASPLLPRPHPQYGHFLAYLRRQSLARMRRKQQQQQQEETYADGVESTVTFTSARPTPPLFHSTSHLSLGASLPESSSMPAISLQTKRKVRPASSVRLPQRVSSSLPISYRLKLNETPPLKQPPPSPRILPKKPSDDQSLSLTQNSVLITPANSVVDEAISFPTKKAPYELQLSGDMLNYCYVSDSGVKYQGQLLSSPV